MDNTICNEPVYGKRFRVFSPDCEAGARPKQKPPGVSLGVRFKGQ